MNFEAPLSRQALKRLRRDGVPTAMWFVEDHELFTYWKMFAPLYDVFAVIQKGNFPDKLAAVGQPNSLYLPLAADPSVHQDLRRERSDVDPDDRSAMIETMKRWQRTREQIQRLRALAPSAA